jgi:CBS domain-containing protein
MASFVRDIMDPDPPTVGPETTVEDVVRILRDNEVPGVTVVNEGHRAIGIITEADLVIGDEQGDLHLPHYFELFGGVVFIPEQLHRFEEKIKKAFASKARDLMTEDPDTVAPDATIREAARLIADRHHNRLPVVEHGRLVGLVTRVDVLSALAQE